MSLNKSHTDSNAPSADGKRPETNSGAGEGPGMLGYSVVPFPAMKPARSNADVKTTSDFDLSKVNEGTSFPSYDEQPETVNSETGS